MPKEFDQDTLDALAQQGGIANEAGDTKEASTADGDGLPDITLDNKGDANGASNSNDDSNQASGNGTQDPTPNELDTGVNKTLEDAGYNLKDLQERITKDDGISDELVAELKQKIDPTLVDAHVGRLRAEYENVKIKKSAEYQKVLEQNKKTVEMNNYIYDSVGSKDNFEAMGKYLKSNLSETEIGALNAKLSSGNKAVVDEALKAAVDKYNYLRGKGKGRMEGDANGAQGQADKLHLTKDEYRQIMRSDKYKTDPVYRSKIDKARLETREADEKKYGNGHYYGFHPTKGRYSL